MPTFVSQATASIVNAKHVVKEDHAALHPVSKTAPLSFSLVPA